MAGRHRTVPAALSVAERQIEGHYSEMLASAARVQTHLQRHPHRCGAECKSTLSWEGGWRGREGGKRERRWRVEPNIEEPIAQ